METGKYVDIYHQAFAIQIPPMFTLKACRKIACGFSHRYPIFLRARPERAQET